MAQSDGWRWEDLSGGMGAAGDGAHGLDAIGPPFSGLFAGGSFNIAGSVPAVSLARWDGQQWYAAPASPITGGFVFSVRLFDDDGPGSIPPAVYVGGLYTTSVAPPTVIPGLLRWDGGASWGEVGGGLGQLIPGTYPAVRAMEVYDDDGPGPRPPGLYVGGTFSYAGGEFRRNIARWDGSAWETLGSGAGYSGSTVGALAVFDEDGARPGAPALFVGGGGAFERWDGQSWTLVGSWDVNGAVFAMAVFDDDGSGPRKPSLFIGGTFIDGPGVPVANRIMRWDGQQYHPLGEGLTNFGVGTNCNALAVFDEDGPGPNPGGLYVGGIFLNAGGIATSHIARWGCPLPPRCDANCNKSFHPITGAHTLTIADFACFQASYVRGDPFADCNEDNGLTIADFGCFQGKFAGGCP